MFYELKLKSSFHIRPEEFRKGAEGGHFHELLHKIEKTFCNKVTFSLFFSKKVLTIFQLGCSQQKVL
jgi:hypothetical protein